MKKNMGNFDKTVRILIAVAIIILYFANVINGTVAIIGLILSVIFIATGLVGTCPLYMPFGIDTRGKNKTSQP
ncbi:MAG TPA: DUF2892 domain-containing protein [Bacteroidia bacterium]|jgi:hypothetical protein|nr:DUF2892 domain-containing protein [Bacteroidia bacterium]